ncbi:MAG: FCD domain-containing protein [Rubrivivax sp.]|nr:FCD domain-containing protein [Rubrivivax sp.]
MDKASPYRAVVSPRRLRLSDSISAQVEELIVRGTLRPGEVLPPERVLAAQFGVSRPSLREALLRLEARGLLRVARGGGFAITDVTAPTLTDPLVHLLQNHATAEQDVLELRHGIELVAAHYAALRATPADRKRLRECFAQTTKPRGKRDALLAAQADADFHLAVAEASHNVALIHVMHGLHNLLQTSMRHAWEVAYAEPDGPRVLQEQHAQLLDAVLAGDASLARDAAHLHLSFVGETLLLVRRGAATPRTARAAAFMATCRSLGTPRRGRGGDPTGPQPARCRDRARHRCDRARLVGVARRARLGRSPASACPATRARLATACTMPPCCSSRRWHRWRPPASRPGASCSSKDSSCCRRTRRRRSRRPSRCCVRGCWRWPSAGTTWAGSRVSTAGRWRWPRRLPAGGERPCARR